MKFLVTCHVIEIESLKYFQIFHHKNLLDHNYENSLSHKWSTLLANSLSRILYEKISEC